MGILDTLSKVAGVFTGSQNDQADDQASQTLQQERHSEEKIRIQYYRSSISCPKKHKQIVRSVGLTKLNQIVERPDTPSMRGVVTKVPHLLRIVE